MGGPRTSTAKSFRAGQIYQRSDMRRTRHRHPKLNRSYNRGISPLPDHEKNNRYKDRPVQVVFNDKELAGMGFIRAADGAILNNQDGFYDVHPDHLSTYDIRTMTAVSNNVLNVLLDIFRRVRDGTIDQAGTGSGGGNKTPEMGTNLPSGTGATDLDAKTERPVSSYTLRSKQRGHAYNR